MRSLVLSLVLCFSVALQAQTAYWISFSYEVTNPIEALESANAFFETDFAKEINAMVQLRDVVFVSSEDHSTHEMLWVTSDPLVYDGLYEKLMGNADFQKFMMSWNKVAIRTSSRMGKSLLMSTANDTNTFTMVYGMRVDNPVLFATEFAAMTEFVTQRHKDIEMGLHMAMAGGDRGVTHYATISAPSLGKAFKVSDAIFASDAFMKYSKAVAPVREIVQSVAFKTIAVYNMPQAVVNK